MASLESAASSREILQPKHQEIRPLALYFALTFALAWTFWLGAAAIASAANTSSTRALFFLPGTFAPAIAALWLTYRSDSQLQRGELLNRLFLWRVPGRWYVFAASYMVAAKLSAAALYRVTAGAWPPFGSVPLYLMLLATIFSTPVQAGEEIGWRGYALPRLATVMGVPAASLVLGAIWALWHLPLFLFANTDTTGQPFFVFMLAVTAVSVPMTWLYLKSQGSLLLVMLMHAAINNTTAIVPSSERDPIGPFSLSASPMAWLTVIVLWFGAAYFLVQMWRARVPPEPPARHGITNG